MSSPRYAVYFAPPVDGAWWRFGASWLGWDEVRGEARLQPRLPEFSPEEFHALTCEPRRYGFHATLKAPFRLRDKADEAMLRHRLTLLARRLKPVPLRDMVPRAIEDFVALEPAAHQPRVDSLAAACVLELDDLRAPLTPQELARRRPERLDPAGRELLQRFGYPHVLDRYRFHMTLSGAVDSLTADLLALRASAAVTTINEHTPLVLDRLCLFREEHPGAPFQRIAEELLR
jgi:putative phosphonate metabolism protein